MQLNVRNVKKGIDNNLSLGNVFCQQLTVPKNVRYALQMNVSVVLKGILLNLGHLVSTVLSCIAETLKVNAKLSFRTVLHSQIASHVLLDNVEDVNKVSNSMLNKNVLLNDQLMLKNT